MNIVYDICNVDRFTAAMILNILQLVLCQGEEQCREKIGIKLDYIKRDTPIKSYQLQIKCFAKYFIADLLEYDEKIVQRLKEYQKTFKCSERYDRYVINNEETSCEYAVKALNCLKRH